MKTSKFLLTAILIVFPVLLIAAIGMKVETVQEPLQDSSSLAIVSGTIRHNSSPVEGVSIEVVWDGAGASSLTAADGSYSITNVPTGGWIQIFVRPPNSKSLEYRNWGSQNFSGSLVKDFDLAQGFRLEGRILNPDGSAFTNGTWLQVNSLELALRPGEWSGDGVDETGHFSLYVSQGIYNLEPGQRELYPYYMPHTNVEMSADRTGLVITLLKEREPPFPTTPPALAKISVADADVNGMAQVTGSAGSVQPLSAVALVNLSAKVYKTTISDKYGAFQASLFAPPGSSLMVKYDQKGGRVLALNDVNGLTNEAGDVSFMNPLPGTTFQVGETTQPNGSIQEFTSAGAFFVGDGWVGWWFDGSLNGPPGASGLNVSQGDELTVEGTLYITSDAFDCLNRPGPDPNFRIDLEYVFDAQGRTEPWGIWFNSYLFTPTGLPIEKEASGNTVGVAGQETATIVSCEDNTNHTLKGQISNSFTIPNSLPNGIFRPRISLDPGGVTPDQNAAVVTIWYHWRSHDAILPPVTVGDVASPQIPWTLFGDYPINGHRGVQAMEDVGRFAMPTRVVYPPHQAVIPMIDERSGKPLTYRLEPGSHWLSGTDRRMPNPPHIPLAFPGGTLSVEIHKPDGSIEVINPTSISQSSQRTPTLPGGSPLDHGTGHIGDLYHLRTGNGAFEYVFDQYGGHMVVINGTVKDVYGNEYVVQGSYEFLVARVLDLDPAQLPTTPYEKLDYFAQGLHLFPPLPADVEIRVSHLPDSDPSEVITNTISGKANRFGYFQPSSDPEKRIRFDSPGEFRVDVMAQYWAEDGTLWAGAMTWGNVVEGPDAAIEAHGRRGMDYLSNTIDDMPSWFEIFNLPSEKVGIEVYYPYFSGDIHWGNEDIDPGDSIHAIITIKDKAGIDGPIYDAIRLNYGKATNGFRWPPTNTSPAGLEERLKVHEAPLFITTNSGIDAAVDPDVDQWGYFYGSSERPDVHVREIISEDNMGTAYWRFDDTYGYQIGEGAAGDLPGDLKWEFGGAVFRIPDSGINEYAIYSSLWVLLPHGCEQSTHGCARVTMPFRDPGGVSIDGGPIMELLGKDINMLFLPKGTRPGDILELNDTFAFSGHVGPPLNSRVDLTVTSPGGTARSKSFRANKIGWVYDPTFDFDVNETGRWTVDVQVVHDQDHLPSGTTKEVIQSSGYNEGTVLGTQGSYSFYVVEPTSRRLFIAAPKPGFIIWPEGQIEPIVIRGAAPAGATTVHYTIHDKGVVMGQGTVIPDAAGLFKLVYDPVALNKDFSFLSLTAHEGLWQGLADEVAINFLAIGSGQAAASTVTLIGEEVFLGNEVNTISLPAVMKQSSE